VVGSLAARLFEHSARFAPVRNRLSRQTSVEEVPVSNDRSRWHRIAGWIGLFAVLAFAVWGCQSTGPGRGASGAQRRPPMLWPKALEPGDTILFVAPAGPLDPARMARARARLEARGYRVVQRDDLFAEEGYLAGSDERRAAELMGGFLDPEVDAIFPGTGGYGTMRILDRLDYAAIRAHPKLVIGFSDLTALHAALNRWAGLVTFHSPSPMWGLGSEEEWNPFTAESFFRAIEQSSNGRGYRVEIPADAAPAVGLGRGKARGRLVGGNLSLISALEGTPFAIDTRGAILLIEDLREAPYRVDRMLRQLRLAGKLQRLKGAILGQFTLNYDREDEAKKDDPRYTVDGVLRQYFAEAGIPVVMNFPVGHHVLNATLPLGADVEVDADAVSVRILGEED
jgi:muramoyltetrapeptide carboxypeptidase